jgi:hypothetical protein
LFAETRDIIVPIPTDLTRALDQKSQGIPAFRNARKARMQLAKELGRLIAAQRKAEMNARFREAVQKAMTGAGADDSDIKALLDDSPFNALIHWDDIQETQREKIQREHPETVDLTEAIEDARYEVHDFTKWLDNPVRRFLDDVATPIMALATLYPPARAGAMAVQGVRGAMALAPRLAPALGRAAVAIGAGAVAGYDRIRAFFGENVCQKEPMGHKGKEMDAPKGSARNKDSIIHGRKFIGHALDRMQGRGITISVVEDIIRTGRKIPSYMKRIRYYSDVNKISVITEQDGTVVSVVRGAIK